MDSGVVEASLREADPAIRDVHHLHVWQLASGSRMATVHAELRDPADSAQALRAIRQVLLQRFQIQHVTVQVDPGECPDQASGCVGHRQD